MRLHPSYVLEVMPGETPVGYASRIALRMGRTLGAFVESIGIRLQRLLDGDAGAVARLLDVCHLPDGTFADTTFAAAPSRRVRVAGQDFSVDQVNRKLLRVCPACIALGLESPLGIHGVWLPREWHITSLHVCHIHEIPMVTVARDNPQKQRHDFARQLQEALAKGRLVFEGGETVKESGLALHVRHRLGGTADERWLCSMPLFAAIKTTEMVGTAALYGFHHSGAELSGMERYEAGRAGYEVLRDGPDGLRRLLSEVQREYYARNSTSGVLSMFGRIYSFLSHDCEDPAFDPVRDVLRQHIVDTMAVGPGDTVLGKAVAQRRVHSIASAAKEIGCNEVTAGKRLRMIGVLDSSSDDLTRGQATFDAEQHSSALIRLTSALQRADAGRYLGLKRVYNDVAPILDIVGSMNVDKTRPLEQYYAKEDLDAFLSSILGKASSTPSDSSFEPIAKASRRARTSMAQIIDIMRAGGIDDIRLSPDRKGIMSIMVRPKDVYEAAAKRRTWLTHREAARAVNMAEPILSVLVRNKFIPAAGRSPAMLKLADLQAFTTTYVSRHEVARIYRKLRGRQNGWSITKAIAKAGLEPALDEAMTPVKFYRRDSVLASLGPPPI